MKELIQAGNFYDSLSEEEKNELADSIAADIFFINEELQHELLEMLGMVSCGLREKIEEINSFTT